MSGSTAGFLSFICLILLVGVWRAVAEIKGRTAALARIEAKLDLLLADSGLSYEPYAGLAAPVVEAIRGGNSMLTMRLLHEDTGVSMSEAKDRIDEARRRASPDF